MFGLFSIGGDPGGGSVSIALGGALGGGTESWKNVSFMSANANIVRSYTRISMVTPSCSCSCTTDAGTGLGASDTDTPAGFRRIGYGVTV